jgi:hypothetical protein
MHVMFRMAEYSEWYISIREHYHRALAVEIIDANRKKKIRRSAE